MSRNPITKKFMRTALSLVFRHKNFGSENSKLGYARENLGIIEQWRMQNVSEGDQSFAAMV